MTLPHDPSDTRADGRRRSWRVGHTAAAQGLAKIVSGFSQLVLVPVLLAQFGTDVFGWVMTLFALTGLISFADLGVVIALQQRLAEAWGRSDQTRLRAIHHAGTQVLNRLGAVWFAVGSGLAWWLGPRLLPAPAVIDLSTQRAAWLCVAATVAAGVATGSGQRLALAIQSGWLAAGWAATINLAVLLGVIVAAHADANPAVFLLLLGAGVVLPGVVAGLQLSHRLGWRPAPAKTPVDSALSAQLWQEGLGFAPPHLAGALLQSATAPLFVYFGGWSAGAALAVLTRLLGPIAQTHAMLLGPLWPAYAEAMVRDDRTWIRRTFRRSLAFTAACALAPLVIALLLPTILRAFLGANTTVPPTAFAWWIAGWHIATMFQQPLGVLLLGLNRLRLIAKPIAAAHLVTLAAAIAGGALWTTHGVAAALLFGTALGLLPLLSAECRRALPPP